MAKSYQTEGPIYITKEKYEAKEAAGELENGREYRIIVPNSSNSTYYSGESIIHTDELVIHDSCINKEDGLTTTNVNPDILYRTLVDSSEGYNRLGEKGIFTFDINSTGSEYAKASYAYNDDNELIGVNVDFKLDDDSWASEILYLVPYYVSGVANLGGVFYTYASEDDDWSGWNWSYLRRAIDTDERKYSYCTALDENNIDELNIFTRNTEGTGKLMFFKKVDEEEADVFACTTDTWNDNKDTKKYARFSGAYVDDYNNITWTTFATNKELTTKQDKLISTDSIEIDSNNNIKAIAVKTINALPTTPEENVVYRLYTTNKLGTYYKRIGCSTKTAGAETYGCTTNLDSIVFIDNAAAASFSKTLTYTTAGSDDLLVKFYESKNIANVIDLPSYSICRRQAYKGIDFLHDDSTGFAVLYYNADGKLCSCSYATWYYNIVTSPVAIYYAASISASGDVTWTKLSGNGGSGGSEGNYLPLDGGTMTGSIVDDLSTASTYTPLITNKTNSDMTTIVGGKSMFGGASISLLGNSASGYDGSAMMVILPDSEGSIYGENTAMMTFTHEDGLQIRHKKYNTESMADVLTDRDTYIDDHTDSSEGLERAKYITINNEEYAVSNIVTVESLPTYQIDDGAIYRVIKKVNNTLLKQGSYAEWEDESGEHCVNALFINNNDGQINMRTAYMYDAEWYYTDPENVGAVDGDANYAIRYWNNGPIIGRSTGDSVCDSAGFKDFTFTTSGYESWDSITIYKDYNGNIKTCWTSNWENKKTDYVLDYYAIYYNGAWKKLNGSGGSGSEGGDYLSLSGGTMTGTIEVDKSVGEEGTPIIAGAADNEYMIISSKPHYYDAESASMLFAPGAAELYAIGDRETSEGEVIYSNYYFDNDGEIIIYDNDPAHGKSESNENKVLTTLNTFASSKGTSKDTISYLTIGNKEYKLAGATGNYLPIEGGAMLGTIVSQIEDGWILSSNSDSSLIKMNGGYKVSAAELKLYGASNGYYPGQFMLLATKGGASSSLVGTPAGVLTWGGKRIPTITNTPPETGSITYGSFTLNADGSITLDNPV